jgi:hypothetical protein
VLPLRVLPYDRLCSCPTDLDEAFEPVPGPHGLARTDVQERRRVLDVGRRERRGGDISYVDVVALAI